MLSIFADYARVPKDVLEYKRMLGRSVHKAIEFFESGELDMDTVDDQVIPYMEAWQKFKADVPLRVYRSECLVYSPRYQYCGQFDLIVCKPKLALIDIKCVVTMVPETALQTAAYAQAYLETYGEKIDERAGLQLKPDGTYRLHPYKNKNDFAIFQNALNLRRWMMNNGK